MEINENNAAIKRFCTIKEAAEMLRTNENAIMRLIKRNKIKYFVIQNVYFINYQALIEWIDGK